MSKTHVITAWAERASGPGWANRPIWYLAQDESGKLSVECIQPEDQNREMDLMYSVSEAAHLTLTGIVRKKMTSVRG